VEDMYREFINLNKANMNDSKDQINQDKIKCSQNQVSHNSLVDASGYEVIFRLKVFVRVFTYHVMFYTFGLISVPFIMIFENYNY
jgi:hypothetical protein